MARDDGDKRGCSAEKRGLKSLQIFPAFVGRLDVLMWEFEKAEGSRSDLSLGINAPAARKNANCY